MLSALAAPATWGGSTGEMLQEESDLSLIIAQIVQKLKGSNLYAQLERQAWASLQRPEIKLESLKEDIEEFFKISGWEKKLQNAVYSELSVFPLPSHPAAPPEHLKESLVYMRKAQAYLCLPYMLKSWHATTHGPDLPCYLFLYCGEARNFFFSFLFFFFYIFNSLKNQKKNTIL